MEIMKRTDEIRVDTEEGQWRLLKALKKNLKQKDMR